MRKDAAISYRGTRYAIGRGPDYYAIWDAGSDWPHPLESWPDTAAGWSGAWSRFASIEPPQAITAVAPAAAAGPAGGVAARSTAGPVGPGLIALGVIIGFAGLFPRYFASAAGSSGSLASQAASWLPHALYLAAWAIAAFLMARGRAAAGALLAAGVSVVSSGFFLSDIGQALSNGGIKDGLVISLIGWACCAAGAGLALWRCRARRPAGRVTYGPGSGEGSAGPGGPSRPRGPAALTAGVLILAAVGAAISFVPAWDRYVVQTTLGINRTYVQGFAFDNPWLVIAGSVVVMITIVAVVAAAALWRPARAAAALLAGAVVVLIGQVASALAQIQYGTPQEIINVTPGQAARLGLRVSYGVTAAFWIFCLCLLVLAAACAWLALTPDTGQPPGGWAPARGPAPGTAASPPPPGRAPAGPAPAGPAPAGPAPTAEFPAARPDVPPEHGAAPPGGPGTV